MKSKKLSEIEWTTCWMAVRYAIGRGTITSVSLAGDVVRSYCKRLNDNQKKQLADEVDRYYNNYPGNQDKNDDTKRIWKKFAKYMIGNYTDIKATDDSVHPCFEFCEVWYTVAAYEKNPSIDAFIPEENIKEIME
jgi:hypothetical protein